MYGLLPYFMLYSSFHLDEALLYGGLTLVIAVILLWTALAKWALEDRIAKTLDANDAELQVGRDMDMGGQLNWCRSTGRQVAREEMPPWLGQDGWEVMV